PLDYRDDPRVVTVQHPGNHVGIGGGYDLRGTAANVREGLTGYFRHSGLPLAEVPPEQRHDPNQRATLYTENYQTARNGDLLTDEDGKNRLQWSVDNPDKPRVSVKPTMSPEQKATLRQAYLELAPGLKAQGMSPDQCLRVSAACVASVATHGEWGDPRRFLLSKDGERVAIQHENGRFDELRVDQALQQSANAHLDRAQAAEQNQAVAKSAQAEPALTR
ncbi:MAG: hypothetical protein KDF54_03585, partial [Hydrogenophaga sp.]|nr:hypothetical protein [Hydrogenophaga sp.]